MKFQFFTFKWRKHLIFCGLLIALACGFAHYARAGATNSAPVRQGNLVPFVLLKGFTGQPLVQVKVNGTTYATFMVDTGTTLSAIQDTLVVKMGIVPHLSPNFTMDGKPVEIVTPRLELGRFNFPDTPTIILKEKQFPVSGTGRISGIIGMSILRLFAIVFDFQKNTMLMIGDGNFSSGELEGLGFQGAAILPLSDGDDKLKTTPLLVQNGSRQGVETLILDTGSEKTDISYQLAHTLGLPVLQELDSWYIMGKDYKLAVSQATLKLGAITLPDKEVSFDSSAKTKISSSLGVDILSHYRVLMDFPSNKMYLAPLAPVAVQVTPSANTPTKP